MGRGIFEVKTLIAVPCFDMVHTDFMESVVNMQKAEDAYFTVVKNTLIHIARNIIASNAMEHKFERVLWLDSDMRFPVDMYHRLSKTMDETGCDLVTGLYFSRRPPIKPNVFTELHWEKDETGKIDAGAEYMWHYPEGLAEIAACGFGCCLTSVDIMRRVGEEFGTVFNPFEGMGEDMSFCLRAGKIGAKMLIDTTIKCDHIGQAVYNEEYYKRQGVPE